METSQLTGNNLEMSFDHLRQKEDASMDNAELTTRFTYHAPKGNQPTKYELIRSQGHQFAKDLVDFCPESRELSLAITHIENAVMWANAAIARRE